MGSLKPHRDEVHNIAFSEDGKLLATCSSDQDVRVWKLSDSECTYHRILIHLDYASAVAFGPGNKYVAVALDCKNYPVRFYRNPWIQPKKKKGEKEKKDVTLKEFLQEFPTNHQTKIFSLLVAPGNIYVLTCCNSQDVSMKLWDPRNGNLLKTISSKQLCNYSAAISTTGRFITASTMMSDVKIWEVFGLKEKTVENVEIGMALKGHTSAVNCSRFGVNGLDGEVFLATASKDCTWKIWDIGVRSRTRDHKDPKMLQEYKVEKPVNKIAISPSKEYPFVAIAIGCELRFYNYKTQKLLGNVAKAHSGGIVQMWFNHKGVVLATCGMDSHVRLWKVPQT